MVNKEEIVQKKIFKELTKLENQYKKENETDEVPDGEEATLIMSMLQAHIGKKLEGDDKIIFETLLDELYRCLDI